MDTTHIVDMMQAEIDRLNSAITILTGEDSTVKRRGRPPGIRLVPGSVRADGTIVKKPGRPAKVQEIPANEPAAVVVVPELTPAERLWTAAPKKTTTRANWTPEKKAEQAEKMRLGKERKRLEREKEARAAKRAATIANKKAADLAAAAGLT